MTKIKDFKNRLYELVAVEKNYSVFREYGTGAIVKISNTAKLKDMGFILAQLVLPREPNLKERDMIRDWLIIPAVTLLVYIILSFIYATFGLDAGAGEGMGVAAFAWCLQNKFKEQGL